VVPTRSGWNASAGRYLLVPGPTPADALVIDPERRGTVTSNDAVAPPPLTGSRVTLFNTDGTQFTARYASAGENVQDDQCAPPWPVIRLAADTALPEWTIGFIDGTAMPLALDSIAGLAQADSAALASAAARVASTLPVKDEAYFRGLPFAVHSLHRFSPASNVQAFAASLVRRVNQEDSPFEERTFLIAERDSAQAPWRAVYHERSSGTEDEVESTESMAGVLVGSDRRATLVLVHEAADGLVYRLLERSAPRTWRARWTSALGKCG
jgi:hypothetical protein